MARRSWTYMTDAEREEALARGRELRAQKVSWPQVCEILGLPRTTLQTHILRDGNYKRRVEPPPPRAVQRAYEVPEETIRFRARIREMIEAIPEDTRTLTGRLLGDPLPGRRAIDRRDSNVV